MGISLHRAPESSRNSTMLNVVTMKISQCVFSESVKRRVTGSSIFVIHPKVVSGDTIGIQEEQCLRKE